MNLLKSLATVSSMTMVSRLLGFIRDAIIARYFGAGMATDAFFVAFKIPNLLRRIFAEGAFSQAFVPILAEYKSQQGDEASRTFIAYIAGLLTLVLAVITIVGVIAAPIIIYITAPGFSEPVEKFELATTMLRITFPYILLYFISFVDRCNTKHLESFFGACFCPCFFESKYDRLYSFSIKLFSSTNFGTCVCSISGGTLQLLYQLPYLKKIGMLVLPRIDLKNSGVWRVLKQMGPAILGVSVGQVSLIINTIFASFLISGSVSWMYYADRLMEFPSGVLAVALGTILLPSLSKSVAKGDFKQYSELLDWGLRLCLLLALPAAVGLGVISKPLISTLFEYGHFSQTDTIMTQQALIAYSFGLLGLMLVKILAPGFYSRQDIKTPVKIAMLTLLFTQLMNIALIGTFKHAGLALINKYCCLFQCHIIILAINKTATL